MLVSFFFFCRLAVLESRCGWRCLWGALLWFCVHRSTFVGFVESCHVRLLLHLAFVPIHVTRSFFVCFQVWFRCMVLLETWLLASLSLPEKEKGARNSATAAVSRSLKEMPYYDYSEWVLKDSFDSYGFVASVILTKATSLITLRVFRRCTLLFINVCVGFNLLILRWQDLNINFLFFYSYFPPFK